MSTTQATPLSWELNVRQVQDYKQYFQNFDADKDGFIQGNIHKVE